MASTIKQRLRRFNGTDYDTVHLETQESQIVADYAKYAPAGYGLGSNEGVRLHSTDDLNDIVKTGIYYWGDSVPANATTQYNYGRWVLMYVYAHGTNIVQCCRSFNNPRVFYWRHTINAVTLVFSEWIFDRPPAYSPSTYRTSDTFLGYPVYESTVQFTSSEFPAAGTHASKAYFTGGYNTSTDFHPISIRGEWVIISSDNKAYSSTYNGLHGYHDIDSGTGYVRIYADTLYACILNENYSFSDVESVTLAIKWYNPVGVTL